MSPLLNWHSPCNLLDIHSRHLSFLQAQEIVIVVGHISHMERKVSLSLEDDVSHSVRKLLQILQDSRAIKFGLDKSTLGLVTLRLLARIYMIDDSLRLFCTIYRPS